MIVAFSTGAVIGLFFHQENFLGGYQSFKRRIVRLGHIACAALGIINVLFGMAYADAPVGTPLAVASCAWIVGGISMPSVCFLSAWRTEFRHLFFIPVTALILGGVETLRLGMP